MMAFRKPFLRGATDRDKLWELKRAVDQLVDDLNMLVVEQQIQIDALEGRIKELEGRDG